MRFFCAHVSRRANSWGRLDVTCRHPYPARVGPRAHGWGIYCASFVGSSPSAHVCAEIAWQIVPFDRLNAEASVQGLLLLDAIRPAVVATRGFSVSRVRIAGTGRRTIGGTDIVVTAIGVGVRCDTARVRALRSRPINVFLQTFVSLGPRSTGTRLRCARSVAAGLPGIGGLVVLCPCGPAGAGEYCCSKHRLYGTHRTSSVWRETSCVS